MIETDNKYKTLLRLSYLFLSLRRLQNTKMREKAKGRICIAWLLLVTLMPFFMVKTFHHHEGRDVACHSQDGHSQGDSHQCPVCNFTLSPFTQAETFQLHIILPVVDFRPEITVDKVCYAKPYPYHLRAPPACRFTYYL